MTFQHQEFRTWLREAEKLRLYAQSVFSDRKALRAALMEAESKSRRLELEAREAAEMETRAKAKRDVARHELAMTRLEIDAIGSARAQMESELAWVQHALATSEDTRWKMESELDVAQQALAAFGEAYQTTEEEVSRLTNERVSLLVELGASKDELSSFHAEVAKEKKAFEAKYDADFEAIFIYGYGCCAFAHNICGSKPKILDGMPGTLEPLTLEFFIDPRCLPTVVPSRPALLRRRVLAKGSITPQPSEQK